MRRDTWWLDLGPSLAIGAGMIVSTWLIKSAAVPGLSTLAGELVLALAVISADVLDTRLKGAWAAPSWASVFLAVSFLFAGHIATRADLSTFDSLIPIIGTASLLLLALQPKSPAIARRPASTAPTED